MASIKKDDNGRWTVQYRYTDWQGVRRKSTKRGFKTKHEAEDWFNNYMLVKVGNLDMDFESFVNIYLDSVKQRIRESTWINKEYIINLKIIPYFKNKKINEIKPAEIIEWQNELMLARNSRGELYSQTYLKTIHNQLTAIFNYAVKYYGLKSNPANIAGSMGSKEAEEMNFWTKEEYEKFAYAMMDKPISYHAFEVLYWTGARIGEVLALTPSDFDFENCTMHINKSYQRLNAKDIISEPKTKNSKRIIKIPKFLSEELRDYIQTIYDVNEKTRIFPVTKSYMHHEMDRGCKETGVKRIRIHDLRHSHVSLLINMGFSAVAIAERVGHKSIDITYRYSHLFPTTQQEIANKLDNERNF